MSNSSAARLTFDEMLALIEDRSAALRTAAATAGLGAAVPGCPDWSVRDLVAHLGEVHLFWSAAIAAGPADSPPAGDQVGDCEPHGDLLAWSAGATGTLIRSLRAAGPDLGCWTWWGSSGAPMNAAAVARHQVQEAAVHAFDAQAAAGQTEPLPPQAAADGIGEYLTVGLRCMGPWPFEPAAVLLQGAEGGDWLIDLGVDGAQVAADSHPASATVTVAASPSDIVLALYRREGPNALQVAGDTEVLEQFLEWPDLD
jgi:uncharacterized protein (TIGR03083 family)